MEEGVIISSSIAAAASQEQEKKRQRIIHYYRVPPIRGQNIPPTIHIIDRDYYDNIASFLYDITCRSSSSASAGEQIEVFYGNLDGWENNSMRSAHLSSSDLSQLESLIDNAKRALEINDKLRANQYLTFETSYQTEFQLVVTAKEANAGLLDKKRRLDTHGEKLKEHDLTQIIIDAKRQKSDINNRYDQQIRDIQVWPWALGGFVTCVGAGAVAGGIIAGVPTAGLGLPVGVFTGALAGAIAGVFVAPICAAAKWIYKQRKQVPAIERERQRELNVLFDSLNRCPEARTAVFPDRRPVVRPAATASVTSSPHRTPSSRRRRSRDNESTSLLGSTGSSTHRGVFRALRNNPGSTNFYPPTGESSDRPNSEPNQQASRNSNRPKLDPVRSDIEKSSKFDTENDSEDDENNFGMR